MEMEMDQNEKRQHNSGTSEAQHSLSEHSERQVLLKTCQLLFAKDLEEKDSEYWAKFLVQFSLAELRYAFEHWNRNARWFPKPKDISDLCDEYRVELANKEIPIGCERCDWSGFYETHRRGVERFVAPCPCRENIGLRTRKRGRLASDEELAWMMRCIQELCKSKAMEKPKVKQVSGIIPTTKELADQLAKRGKL
jgi:hypothetical protein